MKVKATVIAIIALAISYNFALAQKTIGKIEYLEGSMLLHNIQLELEDYSVATEGIYPKSHDEVTVFKTNFVKKYPHIRNEITKGVGIDCAVAFLLVDVVKTDTFQISKPTVPGLILVGLESSGSRYRIDKTNDLGFVDNKHYGEAMIDASVKSNMHCIQIAAEDFCTQSLGIYPIDLNSAVKTQTGVVTFKSILLVSLANPCNKNDEVVICSTQDPPNWDEVKSGQVVYISKGGQGCKIMGKGKSKPLSVMIRSSAQD